MASANCGAADGCVTKDYSGSTADAKSTDC